MSRRILTAQGSAEYIDKLLQNFNPSEVLIQKTIKIHSVKLGEDFHCFILDWIYSYDYVLKHLPNIFKRFR
jgi:DNA mismatch repair protein MutS